MAAKVMVKSDTHSGLRDRVSKALTDKHGNANDPYGDPYVSDMFPDKVIHTMPGKDSRGKLFSSKYSAGSGSKGEVELGDPKEVEQAYKPISESTRGLVNEAVAFTEAKAFNTKTGELTVTVIAPGFNTSKSRFYTKTALSESGGVFAGAKMFANHATKAEVAARPEGRVQDWVANLGTPWVESDGRLVAKAKVHDAAFKTKLQGLQEAGLLTEMGVSIRAAGVQSVGTIGGVQTNIVESFVACKSVDFVTFPGAGGRVEMMESEGLHFLSAPELDEVMQEADAADIDLISLTVLRERRPDLVEQVITEAQERFNMEKTKEQLEAELKEAQKTNTELTAKLTEAENVGKKATVQATLTTALKESGLPEASQKKLTAQFKESTDAATIAPAIEAEKEYIKALGVTNKPGVRGLGAVQESVDPAAKQKRDNYVAAQVKAGMAKEMAEASADSLGI
jgi:hypothetical protein